MARYEVREVSVGDAGLTARPAVIDRETGRTVKVFRRPECRLADQLAEKLNAEERTDRTAPDHHGKVSP